MSIVIKTNIPSLNAMNALNQSTNALSKTLERLSTGLKINSSKDDAAGSAISVSLSQQISSYNIAQNNSQTGQSMINTANGSLNNISEMLTRIRDLALQSINGIYSSDEREVMQDEAQTLVSEIYRVKSSTLFNSKQILGSESITPVQDEEEAIAQGYTVVKTAKEFKDSLKANNENCKIMLFADIDLNDLEFDGTGSNWTAVGTSQSDAFKGVLDGNGFSISNLKINKSDQDYQGLIGAANNATIKNISIDNADITGGEYAAGLVGYSNNSKIENCSMSGDITADCYAAGLVGYSNNSKIENCSSSITISGNQYIGGLVGVNQDNSIIKKCTSSGEVIGNKYAGGLAGYNKNSTIDNCISSADTTGTNYTGGLIGASEDDSIIKNSKSSADITGTNYTGGLIGYNNKSTIYNCESSGRITGSFQYTGGFVGYNLNSTIDNCISSGIVSGDDRVGGFVGYNEYSKIYNSSSSANVSGNYCTGGLVGTNYRNSIIDNCTSSGNIAGVNYTGGLVGDNYYYSAINNSKTTSTISGVTNTGAFLGSYTNGTLEKNEYNSKLNTGMKAVGVGGTSELGIDDNHNLTISPTRLIKTGSTSVCLQVGIDAEESSRIEIDTGFNLGIFNINIKTEYGALKALNRVDAMIDKVTKKQAELGAVSGRLDSIIDHQTEQNISLNKANSIIKDADIAEESSNYVKFQILQQVTSSILATANQTPTLALALLSR